MGVPRVSGSAEMSVSSSGELEEREPPSIWVRIGLLPVASIAVAAGIGLIMTDFWFLLWTGLAVAMIALIYKTWRGF